MRHIGRLLMLVILVSILSCKKDKAPVTNYNQDKLVAVMIDLYVASGAMKDVDISYKDSLIQTYRSQIAVIHDVDFSKIDADIAILQKHPKIYKELHDIVADSISKKDKRFTVAKNKHNKNRK